MLRAYHASSYDDGQYSRYYNDIAIFIFSSKL